MNRRTKRALKKQVGAEAQEKMAEQVGQFNKLPNKCTACSEPFDKNEKEMIDSWSVVVRQDVVRLFCPHCINKTKEVLDNGDN